MVGRAAVWAAAPQATRDETQCAGEDKKTEARNPKVRKLPSDLHRLKSFVRAVISLIPVSDLQEFSIAFVLFLLP